MAVELDIILCRVEEPDLRAKGIIERRSVGAMRHLREAVYSTWLPVSSDTRK